MLNCRDATRLMSEAQEHTLTVPQRMSLKMHTLMCKGCKNFETQMDVLRKISKSYVDKPDDESQP